MSKEQEHSNWSEYIASGGITHEQLHGLNDQIIAAQEEKIEAMQKIIDTQAEVIKQQDETIKKYGVYFINRLHL